MGANYTKFRHLVGKISLKNKFNIRKTPAFVLEFIDLLGRNRLQYVHSQYKDVYIGDSVFVIEKISNDEYIRRKCLYNHLNRLNYPVAVYSNMYWKDGYFFGKMFKYDMDLFEYLKTEEVDLKHLIKSLVPTLKALHASGIYPQDIKPENIFINIFEGHVDYYFGDLEYALVKGDFETGNIENRSWIRTKHYSPGFAKPSTALEARRNDIYAMAVMIGRIDSYYNNGFSYNVFLNYRGRIMSKDFDDKWKINKNLKYAEKCANFIISGLNYESCICNFLSVLQRTNNNSV